MESSKNRLTITGILVSVVLFAGLFAASGNALASPGTLVVDDDGKATIFDCGSTTVTPHITISAAITAAVDGDVIFVCPGTYGAITINMKKLKIYAFPGAIIDANGAEAVFIENVNTGCPAFDRFVVIDGFKIIDARTNNGVRVEDSCGVFIQRNTIGDVVEPNARGILFQNTDHSWIEKNTIRNSTLEEGIKLELGSSNNAILGNTVFNNEGEGIEITSSSSDNLITQNVVRDNGAGSGEPGFAGILVNSGTGNMLKRNKSLNNLGCEYELTAGTFIDRGGNKANGTVTPLVAGCNGTP